MEALHEESAALDDERPPEPAMAEIVTDGDIAPIEAAIKAKYGLQYTAINTLGKLRNWRGTGDENCGVRLTLEA